MAERPEPYVRRDPGDVIRSGDWNELQVQTREEVHGHSHTGGVDGFKIPRTGIEPKAIDGSLIDPAADVTLNKVTVKSELKVNGKVILGDIDDLYNRFKHVENDKVNRSGDAINGALTIHKDLTLHGGMVFESPSTSSWAGSIKLAAPNSSANADETNFRIIHYNYPEGNQIEFRSEKADGNYRESGILALNHDGRVGIGTTKPRARLDVNGSIHSTPVLGSWHPSAHGPNASTPGNQTLFITFDREGEVTDQTYFSNLGGNQGIRIEKEGYYHIEVVALVYVSLGDYGHLYLYVNGVNVDLDHSHYPGFTTWDDRHSSWKGFVKAGSVVRTGVYHHKPTAYWYHAGPIYTRLAIHKIN